MSAVDDLPKVLRDFLAPELRAVNARFNEVLACLDSIRLFSELDKRVGRLETREPRA